MTSKKTNIAKILKEQEDIDLDAIKKWPVFYDEMQQELAKVDNFAKRLTIVVDTIENIFRMMNGEKILTYEEYDYIRREKQRQGYKIFKNSKNKKRWKKRKLL